MPYNVRLTYASTSTSKPSNIKQDLLDILDEANANNLANTINGVLFYGNDYFFQCIEGRKTKVTELFNKISEDPRHTNLVVLSYHEINDLSFKAWELKFVRLDEHIQQYFNQKLWEVFNPYSLEEGLIDDFLSILIPKENMEVNENAPAVISLKDKAFLFSEMLVSVIFIIICLGVSLFFMYTFIK